MVRPVPPLPDAALVPRGRRGQSDEPPVSALPQDRDGHARDLPDGGSLAAHGATEGAASPIGHLHRDGKGRITLPSVLFARDPPSLPPTIWPLAQATATKLQGAPQGQEHLP